MSTLEYFAGFESDPLFESAMLLLMILAPISLVAPIVACLGALYYYWQKRTGKAPHPKKVVIVSLVVGILVSVVAIIIFSNMIYEAPPAAQ
jgi:RsiW-degrading membrane proteinase PrsW (M82 family)